MFGSCGQYHSVSDFWILPFIRPSTLLWACPVRPERGKQNTEGFGGGCELWPSTAAYKLFDIASHKCVRASLMHEVQTMHLTFSVVPSGLRVLRFLKGGLWLLPYEGSFQICEQPSGAHHPLQWFEGRTRARAADPCPSKELAAAY